MVYKSDLSNQSTVSDGTGGACSEHYDRSATTRLRTQHESETRGHSLSEVISAQILPRLLILHHERESAVGAPVVEPNEICEFGALAMGADAVGASSYFDEMRGRGHSLDTLFLHLLAPTARYLGKLWEEDRCDFVDVTLGVARLQEILAFFSDPHDYRSTDVQHRAVLIAPLGEKHFFGLDMVGRFMARSGWDVSLEKGVSPKQSAELVSQEWVGVVGMALSSESGLEALARMIKHLRSASLNVRIGVMVGGPLFNDHPELAIQVGADAAASDAPTAVLLAKRLLLRQAARQEVA